MRNTLAFIITFIVCITSACGQTIANIVDKISEINEVQSEHVGVAGQPSENYMNFEKLKEIASINTLIKLTEHKNPVVSCYASWGLIDKGYTELPSIFSKYLNSEEKVVTLNGCIISEDELSSEFYHRFWNKTIDKKLNLTLQKLDSLILYDSEPNWLLLKRALENRVYQKQYRRRITSLAFVQGYEDAIFYLSNWHKAEYRQDIQTALLKNLKNNNFKDAGTTAYFKTVAELLKFNDDDIKEIVVKKLRKDRHWEYEKEKFKFLLDQYYIYQSDLTE
jgi:hypothetical protein